MKALKDLEKIDQRIRKAEQAVREAEEGQRAAKRELQEAQEAFTEHFEAENVDELHPEDLHNRLTAARNKAAEPWAERIAGKRRRVTKLHAQRDKFVVDNIVELAQAREDHAHAARDAVIEWLERAPLVERAWAEVEQYYVNLLRPVPGVNGQDVPTLSLAAVRSEAQRVLDRGVPAPLPRSLYGAENVDPTIRSAA